MSQGKTYSFSRLSLFDERCERAYYHKYIEQRPEPSGMPAITGKIFHLAMQLLINEGYDPVDAVFNSIYSNNGLPEGETAEGMISMVKRAYRRVKDFDNEYVDLISELHLVVELEGGRKLQGFLDIIIDDPSNDLVSINDFKTTWSPFSAEDSKQLKLYAWMYKQVRGGYVADIYKGKLIFPRYGEFSDSEIIFTDEEMEEAYLWAVATMERIEAKDPHNIEDWKMTTDRSICEYCPRTALCSMGFVKGLPGDGDPKDELEAAAIGEYIRMQELALKKMKNGLKTFASKHGSISLPGGKWEMSQSEPSPKMPFSVIRAYAEEHGFELEKVFKVEGKVLKKWIEEDSTGQLESQAEWTTPRSSFKFVEEKKEKNETSSKEAVIASVS